MNDENKIDLSIEMYEDLKETTSRKRLSKLSKTLKQAAQETQVWIISSWNGSNG